MSRFETEPILLAMLRAAATGGRIEAIDASASELNWVFRTGLGPLLRSLIPSSSSLAGADLTLALLESELQAKMRYRRLLAATLELLEVCEGRTDEITLLKGISIAGHSYPRPYLRPMADLDFLVGIKDVPLAEAALKDLGYEEKSNRPREFYQLHHHAMPVEHPTSGIRIEIHHQLISPRSPLSQARVFSPESIRVQRHPVRFHRFRTWRLSEELQLLHLACNPDHHRWILGNPVPLFDAVYILRRQGRELDRDLLASWAESRSIAIRLLLLLSTIRRIEPTLVPRAITDRLSSAAGFGVSQTIRLLSRGLKGCAIEGHPIGERFGKNNQLIVWDTLLADRIPIASHLLLPWDLAFPPHRPDRYSPKVLLSRLRSGVKAD